MMVSRCCGKHVHVQNTGGYQYYSCSRCQMAADLRPMTKEEIDSVITSLHDDR